MQTKGRLPSWHVDEAYLCVCEDYGGGIKSGRHRETVNQQQKDRPLMKFVQPGFVRRAAFC